jgi:hypothetical protein
MSIDYLSIPGVLNIISELDLLAKQIPDNA